MQHWGRSLKKEMCFHSTWGDSWAGLVFKCGGVWRGSLQSYLYLCPVHGLRVHGVLFDLLVEFVESLPEDSPQRGFSRTTGAHHHHPCPLSQLFIQLQGLLDLQFNDTLVKIATFSLCMNVFIRDKECILLVTVPAQQN